MRKALLSVLLILPAFITSAAFAEAPAYQLVKDKSFIKFTATQNGAPVDGTFEKFTTDIHWNPDKLDESSIKVEVDIASVKVANPDVMSSIKLPDWLSAEAFPKATFECRKITRTTGSDNYQADGQLTLRGKTLPVAISFKMDHFDNKSAVATGKVILHRNDFGVGQGEWAGDNVIKNDVRVEFHVETEKK